MARLLVAPEAQADSVLIARGISDYNPDAADRFVVAAFDTFSLLAEHPKIGRCRKFRKPNVGELRSWRVGGFKNYLIFYKAGDDLVEIFRVVHGSRDLDAVFGDEPE